MILSPAEAKVSVTRLSSGEAISFQGAPSAAIVNILFPVGNERDLESVREIFESLFIRATTCERFQIDILSVPGILAKKMGGRTPLLMFRKETLLLNYQLSGNTETCNCTILKYT